MPERRTHETEVGAALHILLACAMERLGVTELEVDEDEYDRATARYSSLRVTRDDETYRAQRLR